MRISFFSRSWFFKICGSFWKSDNFRQNKFIYLGCVKIFINFYWFNFGQDRDPKFRIRTWPNRIRLWSVIFCNLVPPKFTSIYFIQTQRRSTWYKHKNWPTHHFLKKCYFSINFYLLFKWFKSGQNFHQKYPVFSSKFLVFFSKN